MTEHNTETLYINNLNEKVSIPKLKDALLKLFEKHGTVLQITAHSNLKMKGQAFVTYETADESAKAQKALDAYKLFDKPIKVTFAKTNSDNFYSQVKGDETPIIERKKTKEEEETRKRKAEETARKSAKKAKKTPPKPKVEDFTSLPPHHILLLQNIDAHVENSQLVEHFEKHDGFVSVRYVKVRNLAFVEYETVQLATAVKTGTDKLSQFGEKVILTYAKK